MQESDIDRYIRESSKSYKECKVKNSARRSSLQKKTLGLDIEKKLASAQLTREEKQLREQLRQMQIDKMKHSIVHNMREKAKRDKIKEESEEPGPLKIPVEPYPVTLNDSPTSSPRPRRRAMTIDEEGKMYARRRGRRVSKEFEDLQMDTETGKLKKPQNMAQRLLSARSSRSKISSTSSSPCGSPTSSKAFFNSPSLRRKQRESSDGSSSSNVSSIEDLHWIGSPEATKSVRRHKKTSEELELNSELHKLSRKTKT